MSWTYTVLEAGSAIPLKVDGPWQAFDPSEAFDIFPNGTWTVSSSAGRAGWLSIGSNQFYPKKGRQMHVVIGVWVAESRTFVPVRAASTT